MTISKSRLEAFSDGVFSIIITLMVFEIKLPQIDEQTSFRTLVPMLAPQFIGDCPFSS
ncbi:MAG: TMEM175 family protein [Candidatus Kapaibacteriota bacterium]